MSEIWPRWERNEGQRLVINCILTDPSLLDSDFMRNVTDNHFTDPIMRRYYKLLMVGGDIPTEVLAESNCDTVFTSKFGYYVSRMKTQYVTYRRGLLSEEAQGLLDIGKTKEANELLQRIESLSVDDEWVDFTEGYKEIYDQKELELSKGIPSSMRTGFIKLDQVTGGMHKGQLWVVGAGVGHGKTVLATQIAKNVAGQGNSVGVFSLEMTRQSVLERFACGSAGIDYIDYVNAQLSHKDLALVLNEMHKLSTLGIRFYDNPMATPDTLLGASMNKGFDLIIIDHLHRVKHSNGNSLNEKAFEVANTAKTVARANDCTVLLISQFNREHTKRGTGKDLGRPAMSDFRDSGMIEAEADTILLLYRPSEYQDGVDPAKAEWIIPKLRFGSAGRFDMRWAGKRGWQDIAIGTGHYD